MLFVHRILFQERNQVFHGVLELPLEFREPALRLEELRADKGLLSFLESDGLLVGHHEFGREKVLA